MMLGRFLASKTRKHLECYSWKAGHLYEPRCLAFCVLFDDHDDPISNSSTTLFYLCRSDTASAETMFTAYYSSMTTSHDDFLWIDDRITGT